MGFTWDRVFLLSYELPYVNRVYGTKELYLIKNYSIPNSFLYYKSF